MPYSRKRYLGNIPYSLECNVENISCCTSLLSFTGFLENCVRNVLIFVYTPVPRKKPGSEVNNPLAPPPDRPGRRRLERLLGSLQWTGDTGLKKKNTKFLLSLTQF